MLSVRRWARCATAGALAALGLAVGWTGDVQGQSCTDTGYTYNASCSGNGNAAGTTVSASATAIAAASATQGLVSNRISGFRASNGAPGGRASIGNTKQFFSFGTSGSDAKSSGAYAAQKAELERKKALKDAAGRYAPPAEIEEKDDPDSMRLGLSAGENPDNRLGLWANGAYFRLEGNATNAAINSEIATSMIGADYRFGPRLLVGIGGGYENTDTDTAFNRGTVESDGFIVAPYVSIGLTDTISLDAVAGYGWLNYDTTRQDPLSGRLITGSTDATRLFGSVDLVAGQRMNNWMLEGRIGASYLDEEQDSYRESNAHVVGENDITVASGNVGARVGYSISIAEPYIAGLYSYDFNQAEGAYDGRNTVGGAAGVNVWLTPNFSINIEGKATHKEDLDVYGGSATVRLNF